MKDVWLFMRSFAASLLCLLLVTCAQNSQTSIVPMAGDGAEALGEVGDYRIGPRDQLQITVFQVPDLNRTVQVNGAGFIALPLIGNVRVAGKSTDQAQDEIAAKLGKNYIRSPQVSVAIIKSGQRVTVNGAVKNPQVITVDGQLTLSQAIAATGGFNELANSQRVHVARVSGQSVQDLLFDHEAIQAGKIPDPPLKGGDIVIAEESSTKVAIKNVKDLLPFAIIGSLMSDVRVKRDIVRVGHLANGLGLYRYRYAWDTTRYVGVIAQEVRGIIPGAVTTGRDGYLRVDYRQLGFMPKTWEQWRGSNATGFNRSQDPKPSSMDSLPYAAVVSKAANREKISK